MKQNMKTVRDKEEKHNLKFFIWKKTRKEKKTWEKENGN